MMPPSSLALATPRGGRPPTARQSRFRGGKLGAFEQRGFTLVEVLVALMLMAVLAGMAWQGLDGISRARIASQERVDETLGLNTVLAQWEQDLQSVYDTRGAVPALGFDGARLRLVRRQPEGLQVVVWSLRERALWRWAGPVVAQPVALQESWLLSQQLLGNEPNHLRMQGGVARWQVYFYRGNAWSNAQSSAGTGPAAPPLPGMPVLPVQNVLPTGVRAVLSFEGSDGVRLQGDLTRDVLLAPQWP